MNTIKRISTFILAAYMLLATGGLSVFHHFCSCTDSIITSLIVEESCCEHSLPTKGCCSSTDTLVCHTESDSSCDCDTDVKVFKVDSSLTPISPKQLVEEFNLLDFVEIFFSIEINDSEQNQLLTHPEFGSPPKTGRDIVISLQRIKIPVSFS